ncbi:MAG: manganese efflux pump [Clostridia bacterium]|nr:manganese efflux pump [Clostridia bacterium]
MPLEFSFYFNSVLLGIGLAMDAFSVSMANGLNEPQMKKRKMLGVAGMFAFLQALMPMIGWTCVHSLVKYFSAFEKFIPWIALVLLCFIGGKMLVEGIRCKDCECEECKPALGFVALLVQGIATSIDALSVGFTISEYDIASALMSVLIIATVTFAICMGGIAIGKKAGTHLADKAGILGGGILIFIGIEIFVTSWF